MLFKVLPIVEDVFRVGSSEESSTRPSSLTAAAEACLMTFGFAQ